MRRIASYIIDNANFLKDNQLKTCSFLIQDERVAAIQPQFKYYRLMKMNVDQFIMTPSYIFLNSKISPKCSFQQFKKTVADQFLMRGCTALITYVSITSAHELHEKLNSMKTTMICSPVDYLIGVKISAVLITEAFIRKCKQEKIPAIFVDLDQPEDLEKIPWSWIKNALYSYNCTFIPLISSSQKKEKRSILSKWKDIIVKEKIPAVYEELEEDRPLSVTVLNKIGIYPYRCSLMNGTEVSYNLYLKDQQINKIDEAELFHYHSDRLSVTVHKGRIVRLGNRVLFKPGYGEYVKVRTPSFFSL